MIERFTNLSMEELVLIGAIAPILVMNINKFIGIKGQNKKYTVLAVALYVTFNFEYDVQVFKMANTFILIVGIASGLYDISKKEKTK